MGTSPLFARGLSYAAQLHRDQIRKVSGEPYIAHLMFVAALVLENGGDETQAIAALLHDGVEDQPTLDFGGRAVPGRLREIAVRFGDEVAELVAACSDSDGIPPKAPWAERKVAFARSIGTAPERALPIIAADKVHNALSVLDEYAEHGDAVFEHFKEGHYNTVWYYRRIWLALSARSEMTFHPLVIRLGELVDQLYTTLNDIDRSRMDRSADPIVR